MDIDKLSYNKIINIIIDDFNVMNRIKLYSFYGREIVDTSDLHFLEQDREKNKIIFFMKENQYNVVDNFRLKCFKLIKKLGEGGFGKVYLSEQRFSKEKYAIKFLKLKSTLELKYVYKEIDALSKLSHNHVIQLISYCYLDNERVALILEYGVGGTLKEYLKTKGRLKEKEARSIFIQLLKAMKYIHNKQITHRDLKPENILFTDIEKTNIKIIDFGVSGLFQGEINKAGSLSYMAPEIVGGWNYESQPAIDVWSLGCILYEILTGEKLFDGKFNEKKDKILRGKFVLAKLISSEAAHLINKMIKVKVKERITLEECFDHSWINNRKLSDDEKKENDLMLYSLNSTINESKDQLNISKSKMSTKDLTSNLKLDQDTYKQFNFKTYLRTNEIETSKSNNNIIEKKLYNNQIGDKLNFAKTGMLTKITNLKEVSLFEINYRIFKNNGRVISYMQPIGYTKEQKQRYIKIKDMISNRNNETRLKTSVEKDKKHTENCKLIKPFFPSISQKNLRESLTETRSRITSISNAKLKTLTRKK